MATPFRFVVVVPEPPEPGEVVALRRRRGVRVNVAEQRAQWAEANRRWWWRLVAMCPPYLAMRWGVHRIAVAGYGAPFRGRGW